MSKSVKPKRSEREHLSNILLYGISKIRKMPLPDTTITLYDDLIEIGVTEPEARFLIRRAKRLGIETN
ncbi:MAG: hypothetical protein ACRDFC_09670 [Ignavibacteria bacterium]